MNVHVVVGEEEISNGVIRLPTHCPVKLGFDKALPKGWRSEVYDWDVKIWNAKGSVIWLRLPPIAESFVRIMDKGKPIPPRFEFDLWIPDPMFL